MRVMPYMGSKAIDVDTNYFYLILLQPLLAFMYMYVQCEQKEASILLLSGKGTCIMLENPCQILSCPLLSSSV